MASFFNLRVPFPRPAVTYTPDNATASFTEISVDPAISHQRVSRGKWFLLTAAMALVSPPAAPAFDASLVRPVISHQRTEQPWYLLKAAKADVQPPAEAPADEHQATDPALSLQRVSKPWYFLRGASASLQPPTPFNAALVRPLIRGQRTEASPWFLSAVRNGTPQPPIDPALIPTGMTTAGVWWVADRRAIYQTGGLGQADEAPPAFDASLVRPLLRGQRTESQNWRIGAFQGTTGFFDRTLVRPLIVGVRVARPEGPSVRYLVGDLRPPAAPFDATTVVRPILSSQIVAVKEGPRVRYLTGDLRAPAPFSAALVRPLIRGLRAERPEQRYLAADLGTTTLLGQEPSGAVAWIEATYRATNLTATYRGAPEGATHRGPNLTRSLRATDLTATYRGEPDDATHRPG